MSAEQIALALGIQAFAFIVAGAMTLFITQTTGAPMNTAKGGLRLALILFAIGAVSGVGFIWAGTASGLIHP